LAGTAETAVPRSLFAGWDVMEADSLAHARFLQQFDPFDVVLVDHAQVDEADRDNLSRLALPAWTSLVVLSDAERGAGFQPASLESGRSASLESGRLETCPTNAEGQGPQHWLPRRPALEHPSLLAVVLSQAAQVSKLQRNLQQLEQTLQTSRCQADRLVELLWQGLPAEGRIAWLTQRNVLERLGEEVTRSQRYAVPLSVVLGELDGDSPQPEHGERIGWVARQISGSKRRCDVAGQYGPNGFLLLLPETTDEGARGYCRRLLPLLERPEEMPEGVKTPPRVRVAVASFSSSSATVQSLLSRAEERLTKAASSL
jgi:hypothetical protein